MEEFRNLDRDIEGSAKRWKKFVESECPEKEKFPQEWKNKSSLQKLCMMRALRPDRMSYAITDFVSEMLGTKYVEGKFKTPSTGSNINKSVLHLKETDYKKKLDFILSIKTESIFSKKSPQLLMFYHLQPTIHVFNS